jgi:dTDP-4-dehydrorhamnose 3,5-epimerase
MPMPVKITPTEIADVLLIETGVIRDDRGAFSETYSAKMFEAAGFRETVFLQDNLSSSRKGTVRGLHYQIEPHAMGKLVRTIVGSIFDVAVDIRRGSPTFGKWVGHTLTAENRLALWVPIGFAHGFQALEDESVVLYKCTDIHTPETERAIHYGDPQIGITWPEAITLVAAKDAAAPPLSSADYNFEHHR